MLVFDLILKSILEYPGNIYFQMGCNLNFRDLVSKTSLKYLGKCHFIMCILIPNRFIKCTKPVVIKVVLFPYTIEQNMSFSPVAFLPLFAAFKIYYANYFSILYSYLVGSSGRNSFG